MATAAVDSDALSGQDSSENPVQDETQARGDEPNNSNRSQETHTQKQAERTVKITEITTERFHGLDELSTCINSFDDHLQAGLQELRSCVANLTREKSQMTERFRILTEEIRQTSVERDHYQLAVEELQQEIVNLRGQLSNQQQEKDALFARIQHIQEQNENHLVNIAAKQRSKRLIHRAVSRWRKKTLDKRLGCTEQIGILEAENNDLRAELLLCQEAAKQAFLRSANVLNSEALAMFQDAATRRLGLEEGLQETDSSHDSSPPRSPLQYVHNNQGVNVDTDRENKEKRGSRRKDDCNRKTEERRETFHEERVESGDDRSYAAYGSSDRMNYFHRNHSMGDLREQANRGTREGYHSDTQQQSGSGYSGTYTLNRSTENLGAVEGKVSSQKRPLNIAEFEPNALQQETRAYLQQLRDERYRRPDKTFVSGFDSQRNSHRRSVLQSGSRHKICTCRPQSATGGAQVPYRCPYCTPVQNSSFGHAKDLNKKTSNITRNTILSNKNMDNQNVLYKPSASTVVIEKHVTR